MKIIDFEKKGNVVRFYLGDDESYDYWGDDWNDSPYDCNAGRVYDKYIKGHKDIAFPFDCNVLEPRDGSLNCMWSKEDMKKRKVPCIIVVPGKYCDSCYSDTFSYFVGNDCVSRYYFEDEMEQE